MPEWLRIEDVLTGCRVSSLFSSKHTEETAVAPVDDGQAEINIFTVASGHLYEASEVSLLCVHNFA